MKRTLLFLSFLLISQYSSAQQNICYINANTTEFQYYIDSCNNELIIDVRLAKEYTTKAIPTAINAPSKNNLLSIIDTLDRDTPILVYCIEGERSVQACDIICKKGFTFVVNLKYGLRKW